MVAWVVWAESSFWEKWMAWWLSGLDFSGLAGIANGTSDE
jgi:hypothetical protein